MRVCACPAVSLSLLLYVLSCYRILYGLLQICYMLTGMLGVADLKTALAKLGFHPAFDPALSALVGEVVSEGGMCEWACYWEG